jgi:1-acyl-sn-glycerol-3-phosphate acyltransferase
LKYADAIAQTREQAHARILAALGEPDLSSNDGLAALQSRRS